MELTRLSSVVRVLLFYFTALLLLIFVGGLLQLQFGLPGVIYMQLLIFFTLPFVFTKTVEGKPFKSFLRLRMLSFKGFAKAVFLGGLSWITAQTMGAALVLILRELGGEMFQPYEILLNAPAWLALLAGALVPALAEELSFRGYVLGALRPLGPTAAVALTGILFGALHLSLIRLLPLALLGVVWSMVAQRSGSILPAMIAHLMNNGIALGLTFFFQGQMNPAADLEALDQFPAVARWIAVFVIGAMSTGFGIAGFFLAASFNKSDLSRPDEAQAEEEALAAKPPEAFAYADPHDVSPEVQAMESELAKLQQRRRGMLQAMGGIAGIVIFAIFVYAAWRELDMVFK
ncbi:MAG: CPBP family intramembrane glutamic endopeptidase [Bacillota bacterium]